MGNGRITTTGAAVGLIILLLGPIALPAPAEADWVVTRDGGAVETDGPWEERGRLIVFTRPDGTLASMRLSDVDLEASRQRTADARETTRAAEEESRRPAPERRAPVARFTEAELPNAGRLSPAADGDGDGDGPATAADGADGANGAEEDDAAPEGPVKVEDWREVSGANDRGIELMGTIRNVGAGTAARITVEVRLYDTEGDLLGTADALLTSSALAPAATATFRASLPDVYAYDRVVFETGATMLDNNSNDDGAAAATNR